ncbi:MAG: hypothetical protein JNL83_14505 [Myxococcales bacterium]|nr:hypothetical protein [Myxococcales bacterium]
MRIAAAVLVLAACGSRRAADDQKALRTEAQVELNKLAKSLKAHWVEAGRFPIGTAAPLPADPCCKGKHGRCGVTSAWHADPVWKALRFDVLDAGHLQFAYESDGTTATARAIADLDCDGTTITFTLRVSVQDGTPRAVLDQPPLDAD